MAVLQNVATNEVMLLNTQHTIGRSYSNLLCIREKDISKTHATIYWENSKWFVRDHSRNGTKVNDKMVHHANASLEKNSKIQFGTQVNTTWKLLNIDPPSSYLQSVQNKSDYIALASTPLYPNDEKPIVSFYLSKAMTWAADNEDTTEELVHGQQYSFGDQDWIFFENEPLEDTLDNVNIISQASLECNLSADEESVEVKFIINDLELNLGERVYNYLLLFLARRRVEDSQAGSNLEEQGWMFVEDLLKQLSKELLKEVDVYYFNIMIHRLRSHLKNLKPYGHLFSNIIERKRGKLRLNHPKIRILKENQELMSYQ